MTTAHRPTYHPAVGSAIQGGFRYYVARQQKSVHDLPHQTKLKYRQVGQDSVEEVKERDLKDELQKREQQYSSTDRSTSGSRSDSKEQQQLLLTDESNTTDNNDGSNPLDAIDLTAYNDIDADDETILNQSKAQNHHNSTSNGDADHDDENHNNNNYDDDGDDDDDERLLQQELQRIKAEREAARIKRESEDAADSLKMQQSTASIEERLLSSNPLLASSHQLGDSGMGTGIKRRWNDDVVFRNQMKGEDVSKKVKSRFINDTVRSDFHRSFLRKYVM